MEISVIIPVYNAEKYVECAVKSALEQKETAEVLLVEDNSPDNALAICVKLAKNYSRVRLIRHSDGKNHGAGESRNLGIKNALFDHIAFLDADDYYLENCFSTAAKVFGSDPSVDGVYSAVGVEFENEEARNRYFATHEEEIATVDKKANPNNLFQFLVLGGAGYIHLNGLVVKKDGLLKVGLLPQLRLHQDMVLTIKLAAMLKLVAGDIDIPVSIRRIHLENRITNPNTNFSETQIKAHHHMCQWSSDMHLPRKQQDILRYAYWRLLYWNNRNARNYCKAFYSYIIMRIFCMQL